MKRLKSNKGVALVVVLAAVAVLTAVAMDLSYNTNVNYHLAKGEADRLKSYYLAKSAYNFMLVELKFDRLFQRVVQSQNLGQYLGSNAQLPLCQQFPMSTGLLRAVFSGGGLEALTGGKDAKSETETSEDEDDLEKMKSSASISDEKSAEEFLKFEGDFDGECVDESTKVSLNGFVGLATTSTTEGLASPFDQYRSYLFRFLSRPQFEELFKAADVRISEVVANVGDWVDTNTQMSGAGGRGGGSEDMLYGKAGVTYPVRNGKLLTLLEAYLIDGVVDDWFAPMIDMFTIYGDGKVGICTASQVIVQSIIWRYVDSTPGLPPLRLEDPEEMGRLTTAIAKACVSGATGDQLRTQVSQAVSQTITAIATGAAATTTTSTTTSQTSATSQTAAGSAASGTGIAAFISTERRYFTLNLTGQVGERLVRIKSVVDVGDQDPKKWKLLYWRVY